MENIFVELAIILFVAFVMSYIVRKFNQPIIIGYIIAGIIISPILLKMGGSTELIEVFSEFGIAFLLFIVGLHLNPKVIKEIGVSSFLIGLGQIILTFIVTFLVSKFLLGFSSIASAYFGIGLSFSSTIIIMKLLSDQKQLDSLFGKISIGILIIQDLVAVGVLMFISSISGKGVNDLLGFAGILRGTILIGFLFIIGYYVLPRAMKSIAKSQELLFLFSICWCFVLAALFSYVGFSMEIGALVAGVILSSSQYATEISSRIRPLRDFFLIIFFIILGLKIQISHLGAIILGATVLSLIALILKPLIIMFLMKWLGFTKRNNFLVGSTLGQISEFSLIVLGVGLSIGHILPEELNTMILTMVITILFSSYIIIYSNKLYRKFSPGLSFFEKKNVKKERPIKQQYDTILFGYNRIGFSILNTLKKINKKYMVVDFNPDTIGKLKKFGIPAVYGDVYDLEFLDELPLKKLDLAISTIPDVETNKLLIEFIRVVNKEAVIILRAHSIEDALELYRVGANYILTPHFLGGEYVAKMIKHSETNDENYSAERKKHIKMLKDIMKKGHEHPKVEKN